MISGIQQNQIIDLSLKLNPIMIGVFGSYDRRENHSNSDLNILIDFKEDINLLDIIGLEQDLTETLGIQVDLITLKFLNVLLKPYVETDLIQIPQPLRSHLINHHPLRAINSTFSTKIIGGKTSNGIIQQIISTKKFNAH